MVEDSFIQRQDAHVWMPGGPIDQYQLDERVKVPQNNINHLRR